MLATLRNRNFALLWLGALISGLGDWLLFIALPFYIYDLTGSALATGAMFIAETVPGILLSSVAGVFADRWDRRRTLIVADVLRAVVILLVLLIHNVELVWLIYLAVCFESAVSKFFEPAKSALIPHLVADEQLVSANALSSLSFELTRLIGPMLGGVLIGIIGIHGIVLIDSISYILSAVCIVLVRVPANRVAEQPVAKPNSNDSPWQQVWHELLAGLRLIVQQRWIVVLFTMMGIVMIGQGITNVMLVPFIYDVLHVGPREFGWIVTAQAIGGLSGGLFIGEVGRRISPRWLIVVSSFLLGVLMCLLVTFPNVWIVIGLVALAGWPAVGLFVGVPTLLQRAVPDAFRGRMFGAFNTIQSMLMLVGLGIASLLGDKVGALAMFMSIGALYGLAALVGALFLGDVHVVASEPATAT